MWDIAISATNVFWWFSIMSVVLLFKYKEVQNRVYLLQFIKSILSLPL
jgi:hypothetical protein